MPREWFLAFGLLLGLRHACDPDHVVAVTSILGRTHRLRDGLQVGLVWGLGHSATVFVVGFAIVVLGVTVPPRFEATMDLVVAAMLVLVGALALRPATRTESTPETAAPGARARVRPLLVGVVHGLAGSATVALLALTELRSPILSLAYLVLFGVGTIVGMALVTLVLAVPFVGRRAGLGPLQQGISRIAGIASIALGGSLLVRHLVGAG